MRRLGFVPALALTVVLGTTALSACSDEGEPLPARCTDPKLPVFDYRHADPPADDNEMYPCVTPVGHGIGSDVSGGAASAPPSGGGANSGGDAGTGGS